MNNCRITLLKSGRFLYQCLWPLNPVDNEDTECDYRLKDSDSLCAYYDGIECINKLAKKEAHNLGLFIGQTKNEGR